MKMKINIRNMGIIIIVVIFAGISATIAAGVWTTESDKIPATYKEGEFEGLYNPEDIRGSYTFKEVSDLFEIDLDVIYKAFGLENINNEELKSKDLEGLYAEAEYEIGNGSVQVFVALYKDLPIVLEDTYLPEQAVEIILENNKNITEEQLLYLKEHTVILPEISGDNLNEEPKEQTEGVKDETTEEENLVKGATTFKQVLDAGITKQQIEEILGMEMPSSNMAIKDFCLEKGLLFSEVKTKLNDLSK
jgi:hypothetical protein